MELPIAEQFLQSERQTAQSDRIGYAVILGTKGENKMEYVIVLGVAAMMGFYVVILARCLGDA